MSVNVSFARLEDGAWGLRFSDRQDPIPTPAFGESVKVKKKNGTTATAIVGDLVARQDADHVIITKIVGKIQHDGKYVPDRKGRLYPKKPQHLPNENQHYTATSVALEEGRPKATRTTLRIKTQEGPTLNIYFDNGAEEELFGGLFEPEEG